MENFGTKLIFAGIFLLVLVFIVAFIDSLKLIPSPSLTVPIAMVIATVIAARFLN